VEYRNSDHVVVALSWFLFHEVRAGFIRSEKNSHKNLGWRVTNFRHSLSKKKVPAIFKPHTGRLAQKIPSEQRNVTHPEKANNGRKKGKRKREV
jgi:hypothetical protein